MLPAIAQGGPELTRLAAELGQLLDRSSLRALYIARAQLPARRQTRQARSRRPARAPRRRGRLTPGARASERPPTLRASAGRRRRRRQRRRRSPRQRSSDRSRRRSTDRAARLPAVNEGRQGRRAGEGGGVEFRERRQIAACHRLGDRHHVDGKATRGELGLQVLPSPERLRKQDPRLGRQHREGADQPLLALIVVGTIAAVSPASERARAVAGPTAARTAADSAASVPWARRARRPAAPPTGW